MANRKSRTASSWSLHSDIVVVGLVGLWTVAIALGYGSGGPGRLLIGFLAVLFAPGYALVSALLPRRRTGHGVFPDFDDGRFPDVEGVTIVERLLLAVGLSVCLVPLIGLGIHFSPWAIRTTTLLGSVGSTTVTLSVIGATRRFLVPRDVRFTPRYAGFATDVGRRLGVVGDQSYLSVLLVVGLLVAAGGIGFAVIDSERGEQFTELSLTTEDPATNESVAGGYPEVIPLGESDSVQVGITNDEGETVDYTLVVYLQSFEESGEVRETVRLDSVSVTVADGETVVLDHEIRPTIAGEDLKLSYHLYIGTPPAGSAPSADDSYRNAHIWIDVPRTETSEES